MPMHFDMPQSSHNSDSEVPAVEAFDDNEWRREQRIPASEEMVNSLSVGDEVTIMLKGQVTGLESEDTSHRPNRHDITISMERVTMQDAKNEFEQLVEDDE